jgi:prepilin-type N-terminal cleavage/methylation domain-containing protein
MRQGFTLLEVVIALVILSMALFILVDAQASSVLATADAEKTLVGTYLAQQKMTEATLRLEKDGFRTADVDEEGDFEDYGKDEVIGDMAGGGLGEDLDFGDAFEGYQWAYTIREVDVQLGDLGGAQESLQDAGFGPTEDQQAASPQSTAPDLGDVVSPDMISQLLSPYIREVRVMVWWGEEPDPDEACEDCVELVTHVINPSGEIFAPPD